MSIEVNAVPAATVRFFRNGKEIREDDRIKFLTAENYYIIKFNHTVLEDAGNYSVGQGFFYKSLKQSFKIPYFVRCLFRCRSLR